MFTKQAPQTNRFLLFWQLRQWITSSGYTSVFDIIHPNKHTKLAIVHKTNQWIPIISWFLAMKESWIWSVVEQRNTQETPVADHQVLARVQTQAPVTEWIQQAMKIQATHRINQVGFKSFEIISEKIQANHICIQIQFLYSINIQFIKC